jgi:hypothetical protein
MDVEQLGTSRRSTEKLRQKLSYTDLLTEFQSLHPILAIGVLQLHPSNHGLNDGLEMMATEMLSLWNQNNSKPAAAWSQIAEALTGMGRGMPILPLNTFTSNVIFATGNKVVYPGLHIHGARVLSYVSYAILNPENGLPEGFRKTVSDAIAFLLEISNLIARGMGHSRYLAASFDRSIGLKFPSYEEAVEMIDTLTFTRETIDKIADMLDIPVDVFKCFIIDIDSPELRTSDGDNSIVSRKPFIAIDGGYYLYMPTVITHVLVEFAFERAEQAGCLEHFRLAITNSVESVVEKALHQMRWKLMDTSKMIGLTGTADNDLIYQFDSHRFAFVAFLGNKDDASKRSKIVREYLAANHGATETLTLFIHANINGDVMWAWGAHEVTNYELMFQAYELETIARHEETHSLSLLKFAKTLRRTGLKVKIVSRGMASLFAHFMYNQGSILDAVKTPGQSFSPDDIYTAKMFIEHEQKEDQHGVPAKKDGQTGFIQVERFREYAPIYKPTENENGPLLVEVFKFPIWIINRQHSLPGERNWAFDVVETIAFWLIRLSESLRKTINATQKSRYDIEIVVDDQFLTPAEFEIPDELPSDTAIPIAVTNQLITIQIPFEFGLLAARADNLADKALMTSVINSIKRCAEIRGATWELSDESIIGTIHETLVPANAKMLMFQNGRHNVRIDRRNLPVLLNIDEADTSKILEELLSYLPTEFEIPEQVHKVDDEISLVENMLAALLEKLKGKLKSYDGLKLLEHLIALNETCTMRKERSELLRPAKIACFSSFPAEVDNVLFEHTELVRTGLALRTLIEFTGTCTPTGSAAPGYEDIGELLAFADQLVAFGQLHEILQNRLANIGIGKLPSGRLGIDRAFQQKVFGSLQYARAKGKVLAEVENFETSYSASMDIKRGGAEDSSQWNAAFQGEFGFTFNEYCIFYQRLIEEGFENGETPVIRNEEQLLTVLVSEEHGVTRDKVKMILEFLTLPKRNEIVFSKNKKNEYDKQFIPWRYNRPYSFLMKPLVRVTDKSGNTFYYFGFRHLQVSMEHLIYLIHEVKLPSPKSKEMKSLLGTRSGEIGAPFEQEIRDWLKKNTSLEVCSDQVYPWRLSGRKKLDAKFGDIDVFAADHAKKIIYSIECKNTRGARNVIEMVGEMNVYLGREDTGEKSKILKHYERDEWLKSNLNFVESIIPDASSYTVKSLVLTADELSISYLAADKLLLPVLSFSELKLKGIDATIGKI